jgi:hypothetical protein
MSFGFGISDVLTLVQLAYATFDGARRACGEHDDLTQEISSLVTVLDHVQSEISDPDSNINKARGRRRKELENHIEGCRRHVKEINTILNKFNSLSEAERGVGSFWQKVKFGNGPVKDIAQIRQKISTYTNAINILLTLLSLDSRGEAERQLSRQSGELRGITQSVNMLVAQLNTNSREGSIWTKWSDDDLDFWREFRSRLVKEGYKSRVIKSHEFLIQAYIKELDAKGALELKDFPSSSSADLESVSVHSNLPELDTHSENPKLGAKIPDGVSELSDEQVDVFLETPEQMTWPLEDETDIEHRLEHDVGLFDRVSAYGQGDREPSAQDLGGGSYTREEGWEQEDIYPKESYSPEKSGMAQKIEYLERLSRKQQQLLRTMSGREGTTDNEGIRVYKLLPSSANRPSMKLITRSTFQSQQTKPKLSYVSTPQSVAVHEPPTDEQAFGPIVEIPLDKEALARIRDEAFKRLSAGDKKIIITM